MSDTPHSHLNLTSSDTHNDTEHNTEHNTEHSNETPFLLPNYDHGFFYKKLFEINDNVQHLKRHIIVAKNDNINDTIIHQLWDNKISPFLNTLSERIKTLEDKFETYYTPKSVPIVQADDLKSDIAVDDISVTNVLDTENATEEKIDIAPTHIDMADELILETAQTADKTLTADIKTIPEAHSVVSRSDLLPEEDEEETFANLNETYTANVPEGVTGKSRDAQMNIKEKTLDELSKFLETKMKELYDNDFSKERHLKTEQPV
jgi:hypothetical protein